MRILILSLLSLAIGTNLQPFVNALSCQVPGANPDTPQDVSWFLLYKPPRSSFNDEDGRRYFYVSNLNQQKKFEDDITNPENNPLALTFMQTQPQYPTHFTYNDAQQASQSSELPFSSNNSEAFNFASYAHTKGTISLDSTTWTGYWLIHSVPKLFVDPQADYLYPSSGITNGQILFCFSLTPGSSREFDNLEKTVTNYLSKVNPQCLIRQVDPPYDRCVPPVDDVMPGYDTIEVASFNEQLTHGTFHIRNQGDITNVMSKNIYKDRMTSSKAPIYVQTWRPSLVDVTIDCEDLQVIMINPQKTIKWKGGFYKVDNANRLKSGGKDHSKWAIQHPDHVCIGDLNKQDCKGLRNGGILCFRNTKIYNVFHDMLQKDANIPVRDDDYGDPEPESCDV